MTFRKSSICPNFHESESWPFAKISAKKCKARKKKGGARDGM
jgi:hypothetical protein